jgi:serine/threonine-protein kinase
MVELASSSSDRANAVVGKTIAGKFLVASYLGGGGVGAVYKATHLGLDKVVAIKLLHGEHAGDAMFAARFEREAKAASKLDHPNSMRVLDFGVDPDGLAYIAMEYLDGRNLLGVMEEDWPLAPERVADIMCQALAAVGAASAIGLVHRDLKPENIMVLRGTDDEGNPRDVVKVCDFGIAKFIEDRGAPLTGEKLTKHGMMVGTPEYMSPEHCLGEPLDVRSDLYSMGVILYQLLTGRTPFLAETALGIVMKHINEEPPPPSKLDPLVDERLEVVCMKALRKNRAQRYQNAREMRAELRTVVGTWAPEPLSQVSPVEERSVVPSVEATKQGLAQQPPAEEEELDWEIDGGPTSAVPTQEPSVIMTPEPVVASSVVVVDAEVAGLKAREERGPTGTVLMKAREGRGPTGTALMKAREERGPTGTVLMKAREGRGPTGTALMKARGGGLAGLLHARSRVWLVVAAVLGVLALGATAWALARR